MKNPLKRLLNQPNFPIENALLLIGLGCDPTTTNSDGHTLAHLLVGDALSGRLSQEKKDALTTLVRTYKVNINKRNVRNQSPLQCLMDKKNWSTADVMFLIDLGANPNTRDSQGQTIIHRLALINEHKIEYYNQQAIYKLVKQYSADINSRNKQKKTALQCYINQNYFEFYQVLYFLDLDVDSNTKNDKGEPLIHIALHHEQNKLTAFLRKHPQTITSKNAEDKTALQSYMDGGFIDKDIATTLLEFKADPHSKNSKGESLLHLYAKYRSDASKEIDDLINIYHTDPTSITSQGFTPLQIVIQALHNNTYHPNNVSVLIDASNEFNEQVSHALKSEDQKEIENLNRLMTRIHANKGYDTAPLQEKIRRIAFNQLQIVIKGLDDNEEQIAKLQWARTQPLFCMHRSDWFLATIGRTHTVTLIDQMIEQIQPKESSCGLM